MIRINLLGGERHKARKAPAFDVNQRLTAICGAILAVAVLGVGWWYWSLGRSVAQLDVEIASAQTEAGRLRSLMTEVQQFEGRRAQLQQRVQLIEQLRGGQSLPVQLLDHVSRSLPDTLWLTDLQQAGNAVTIEGRSMTLIALSDFVGNLGSNPVLKKPIEIVNSQVEPAQSGTQAPVDLIKFTVKAELAPAKSAAAAPAPAPGPAR